MITVKFTYNKTIYFIDYLIILFLITIAKFWYTIYNFKYSVLIFGDLNKTVIKTFELYEENEILCLN